MAWRLHDARLTTEALRQWKTGPFTPLLMAYYGRMIRRTLWEQGIGRHSSQEVLSIAEVDLKALSDYLGSYDRD